MSINKNAIIRYQCLDKCFRNPGRMYFIDDLLKECNKILREFDSHNLGIQKRQLYDDIRFMESEAGWSIPLERYRHSRKVYYRYSDLTFSINNEPLNNMEAEQINSALQILARFSGTPQFEWVNEMIPMLESKFGLIGSEKKIINFESNIDLKGLEHLTPFFNAILNERVLKVLYKDFNSLNPYEVIFHPHYLKQYNTRWFVLGLNEDLMKYKWNLALDRVIEIEEMNKIYIPTDTDWDEYFYDIIGVTRIEEEELQEFKFLVKNDLAPYILSKPLHPSQKIRQTENGLEVRINVIPNYELERLILSFGEQIQVLAPEKFRIKILNRITDLYNLYEI